MKLLTICLAGLVAGLALTGGGTPASAQPCVKPKEARVGYVWDCNRWVRAVPQSKLEKKLLLQKAKEERARKMKQEMEAEARALRKADEERKRNMPRTEHCYMKNGKLDCKPA